MKFWKSLVAGALLVIANVASATLFTYSSSGYIDKDPGSGYDGWGIFGTPGRHLDGLPFSLSVSYMLGDDVVHVPNQYTGASGPMPFMYSVTVGGHTYSSAVQPTYDVATYALVENSSSMGQGMYDIVSSRTEGVDAQGRDIGIYQYIQQYYSFVGSSNSLEQFFTHTSRIGEPGVVASFGMSSGYAATNFVSHGPMTVTINGTPVTAVPEPASVMLISCGLFALAITQRRRARTRRRAGI